MGQFGENIPPEKVAPLLKEFGFKEVYEVALGADISAVCEAELFLSDVPSKQPFLATSCCPSWASMAKKLFPEIAHCVSEGFTPMVATARMIKKKHPNSKIVFIGPCSAKKLEAMRKSVRSDVDFVITFEEMVGMFTAKGIVSDFGCRPEPFNKSTAAGRGYAKSGGVAEAIINSIKEKEPDRQIKTECADNLSDCRKMLSLARAGKRDGYILEGMACPGGCIGGAGTTLHQKKAMAAINKYKELSEKKLAEQHDEI